MLPPLPARRRDRWSRAAPSHPPPRRPSATKPSSRWPQLDAWLAKIEAAELTALDTETTSLDPFAARIVGISLSVLAGRSLLHPARPHRPRRCRPVAARRSAGAAEAVAGIRDAHEGAAEPQVRPARPCQPRHRAGRRRPRHDAAELRPRVRQGPRPRPAMHAPPRSRHHRLRGPVRQGGEADRLRPGRHRTRRDLCGRGRRRHAARPCTSCIRASPTKPACRASTTRSRCRCAKSSGAWSAPAS